MKYCKPWIFALLSLFIFSSKKTFAQLLVQQKLKIAVLSPLYLDSAFSDYSYKLGNDNMPQYILTGLDFYNGVMMAVDSLNKQNINAEVWVYDTKKQGTDINSILQSMKPLGFSLILASLSSSAEQKSISVFSFANNIPVISVTYPNDAGLTANPYFIMLNSTLKTHVEGIYQYIQKNYWNSKPLFVTRTGSLESKISDDFKANDTVVKNHFPYKVMQLNDDVYFDNLQPFLDSNRQNVIVCGSMNIGFALSLVKTLGNNPQYRVTLIGMPNWDGIRKLYNNSFTNLEIVYSSPFNYAATDDKISNITSDYRAKFFARPSDLVYKGFESMYYYTRLVKDFRNEFTAHLSDSSYRWSNQFSVQPVMLSSQSLLPDYLENKNLYFIKKSKQNILSVTQVRKDN